MARGTVKDPEGHQSKPYDFGYIQREPESVYEFNEFKWKDGSAQMKVIPYNQKVYKLKLGDAVTFKSREAHIIFSETLTAKEIEDAVNQIQDLTYEGTIGMADQVEDVPREELNSNL